MVEYQKPKTINLDSGYTINTFHCNGITKESSHYYTSMMEFFEAIDGAYSGYALEIPLNQEDLKVCRKHSNSARKKLKILKEKFVDGVIHMQAYSLQCFSFFIIKDVQALISEYDKKFKDELSFSELYRHHHTHIYTAVLLVQADVISNNEFHTLTQEYFPKEQL